MAKNTITIEQTSARRATDLLLRFSRFQNNLTEDVLEEIYGEAIGQHLYRSYLEEGRYLPIWKFSPRDMKKLSEYLLKIDQTEI